MKDIQEKYKKIYKSRIGQRFNKLVILGFDSYQVRQTPKRKTRRAIFRCACDCGQIKNVAYFNLQRMPNASCGCANSGSDSRCWKGFKEITGVKFNGYKWGAISRGLDFKISIEYVWDLYVQQKGKCMISGQSINLEHNTASIDRVDSNIGYVIGNVQWVHRDINKMKNNLNEKLFIENCKKVTQHQTL